MRRRGVQLRIATLMVSLGVLWCVPRANDLLVVLAQEGASSDAAATEADGSVVGGETQAEATVGDHPETYLEFAMSGGWLMLPIGICSLVWVTYLVERFLAVRRQRVMPAAFTESVALSLSATPLDLDEIRRLCAKHPCSAATILSVAVECVDAPRVELEEAVNHVAQREIHGLRRNLRLFAVIAAVAPLLGLLGTVTGMIRAFREVAIQGLGSGQALAPGIYQALVTTAGGLLVAIPALLTYHWFMGRVDQYVRELDDTVVEFVQTHRRQRGGAAADAERPAEAAPSS